MKEKVKLYGRDCAVDYEGPLTPPDRKRCQHELHRYHPFTMGGNVHQVVRCEAAPAVIAIEKETKRKDGRKGSMSLCLEHMAILMKSAPGYCTYKEIRQKRKV